MVEFFCWGKGSYGVLQGVFTLEEGWIGGDERVGGGGTVTLGGMCVGWGA